LPFTGRTAGEENVWLPYMNAFYTVSTKKYNTVYVAITLANNVGF